MEGGVIQRGADTRQVVTEESVSSLKGSLAMIMDLKSIDIRHRWPDIADEKQELVGQGREGEGRTGRTLHVGNPFEC